MQQAAGHAAKIIIKSVTNGTFANAREHDPPQYEQLILFGLSGIFSAVLLAGNLKVLALVASKFKNTNGTDYANSWLRSRYNQ